MFMEERQKDILKRINATGRIQVAQIQELYNISADCARRDLRFLESRGLLQRTHGGAIAAQPKGIMPEETYNPEDLTEVKADYLQREWITESFIFPKARRRMITPRLL